MVSQKRPVKAPRVALQPPSTIELVLFEALYAGLYLLAGYVTFMNALHRGYSFRTCCFISGLTLPALAFAPLPRFRIDVSPVMSLVFFFRLGDDLHALLMRLLGQLVGTTIVTTLFDLSAAALGITSAGSLPVRAPSAFDMNRTIASVGVDEFFWTMIMALVLLTWPLISPKKLVEPYSGALKSFIITVVMTISMAFMSPMSFIAPLLNGHAGKGGLFVSDAVIFVVLPMLAGLVALYVVQLFERSSSGSAKHHGKAKRH